ncbi:hypothetical protein PIB30_049350 [Stylosanthes scabra]|uniref:Uncharacterized protein n=1 Tax=Stylosanthes scabra TaxID=79078 RepID=A0ABU6RHM6_9FABA|nr:hypothetical protein [Stylosanthes scabra]
MATGEFFFVAIYPNGVIRYGETGVMFESSAPVMFPAMLRSSRLDTLNDLKNLILANVSGGEGLKEIGNVGYKFTSIMPGGRRFMNHVIWVTGDDHVRWMFDVHWKLMPQQVMELYAEVRDVEVSSEFFFIVIYANGVIRNGENGEIFESSKPVMFRSFGLDTLHELKNLILMNVSGAGLKEIGNVGYRLLSQSLDGRFENRVLWVTGDDLVRWMFDVHRKLTPLQVMELYAEDPPLAATPIRCVGPGDSTRNTLPEKGHLSERVDP